MMLSFFSLLTFTSLFQLVISENACPVKWMTFERPQGRWCVRVFFGVYTRDLSETQCQKHDATLSGIQSNDERLRVAAAGRAEFIRTNPDAHELFDATLWLGAERKSACTGYGVCAGKDVFQWTDGFTNGTDGFSFVPGKPGVSYSPAWGGTASCLQQFVFYSGTSSPRWPGVDHGALSDNWCTETVSPRSRLYACGKRPE